MSQRLASAPNFVQTEYVALLADDEFFLHSGIRDAIRHLDSNPETIGCVGRCLYFFVDQGRFLLSDAYRDWRPFPASDGRLQSRIEADLPPNKTHMAAYAVFRREMWSRIMGTACQTQFTCPYTYERLMNLQRTLLGPTDILENLLWMRSKENPPVSTSDWLRTQGYDFVSWASAPRFAEEVFKFREIARSMFLDSGVCETEAEVLTERFFRGLVERQKLKEARFRNSLKRRVGQFLLTNSPKGLRLWAKRGLPGGSLRLFGWEGHSPATAMAGLNSRGTKFLADEISFVKELVLNEDLVN